jgi:hypothetical protein
MRVLSVWLCGNLPTRNRPAAVQMIAYLTEKTETDILSVNRGGVDSSLVLIGTQGDTKFTNQI